MVSTLRVFGASALFFFTLFFSASPTYADHCPNPGEVHITAETRAAAKAAGIPDGRPCWKPADKNIGADAGQAKQYLRNMLCNGGPGNFGGAGPDGTITELNSEFAACAARFLRFAKQNGKSVCIKEGFRTVETQNKYAENYKNGGTIACTLGAQCEHPKGIAIDVNSNDYSWLWNNACQFGLDFYLREKDKVHFVPLSHSRARGKSKCGAQAQTVSCLDPNFTPKDAGPAQVGPPTRQYMDQLRDLFQPRQEQPSAQMPQQSPGQMQTPYQGQPTPQIPPGYCIKNLNPLEIVPCPTPAQPQMQQPYQYSPTGQNISTGFGQPQPVPGQTTPIPSSVRLPTSTAQKEKPEKSGVERVSDWIYTALETKGVDIATPVELTISDEDPVRLEDKEGADAPLVSSTRLTYTESGKNIQSDSTFTSPDLANVTGEERSRLAGYQTFLQRMKETLLTMLAYLKPFGRPGDDDEEFLAE